MKNPLKYIRKNILDLEPYSTARDEFQGSGVKAWLDANESPYPNGLNRYPDPHTSLIKEKVAKLFSTDRANIFIGGAGSDEAIDLVYRIFCEPGKENVITIAPTYGVYKVAADINDIEMKEVLLNTDFSLPVEDILNAVDPQTKVIWICSPNNPTGNAFSCHDIEDIARRFDGMVVVDEAYNDFADTESMLHSIDKLPNIIVLKTFSKARGLAGLRAGMAFADSRIINYFDRVKYPYNMSVLVQRTLLEKIDEDVTGQIKEIKEERNRLKRELEKIQCILKVYPSDANFLLVKTTDANVIYQYLANNGIVTRNRSKMPLCEDTLRITVGTPAENELLINLLKKFEQRGKEETTPESYKSACSTVPMPDLSSGRQVEISRKTSETDIKIALDLDGKGISDIDTGLKFFDHVLSQIPHHSGISLTIRCKGDLEVDEHHTMEDVAIVLGEAIIRALGNKRGIERYGFVLPMDESRAMVLIDLGGRIDFQWDVKFTREYIGDTPTEMFRHFFHSLACALKCNLHIEAKGENNHHLIEGIFKAFAHALKMAIRRDPFSYNLPSSKGIL